MAKLNISLFRECVLKYIVIIFLSYDFMTKILVSYFNLIVFYNYAIIFKTIIIIVAIFYLNVNFIKKNILIVIASLSFCFIIGSITLFPFFTRADILFNGYYFLSSLVPIIFLFFFYYYDNIKILKFIVNSFIWFMAVNAIAVFLGLFLELDIFKSYWRGGGRYGYQGLLLYHSEAGYLFFLALNMLYFEYKKNKTLILKIIFVLIFSASLLVGTKKTILLSVIFLSYLLFDNYKTIISKKALKYFAGLIFIGFLLRNQILNVFLKQYYLFYEIYKDKGFLTSFLSFRDVLLREKFFPYINEQWSLLNFIFGGPSFSRYRVELEFFDLILFFGIVGLVSYILLFTIILKNRNKLIYFIVFMMTLASLFSGNLFSSMNVLILLFVCTNYIALKPKTSGF